MKRAFWIVILAAPFAWSFGDYSAPAPKILDEVGIDQRLGQSLPLDLTFKDQSGQTVRLQDYFSGHKPVLLTLVYYQCPMLCSEVLNGLVRTLRVIPLSAGRDFQIVTVSFDPSEKPELAAKKRLNYLDKYHRPGADQGWSFLTGDAEAIHKLTQAVGFRYAWDQQAKQFAHAAAIMIATPDGKLSRYFFGVEYPSQDVRLSLVEASNGKIGSLMDQVLLYCFHYDPATGRYGLLIMRVLQLGAILTVLFLGLFIGLMLWREKHMALKENHAR